MQPKALFLLVALMLAVPMAWGQTQAPAAVTQDAYLRFVHASPDAPAVDVYINGQPAFSDLAFKSVTTFRAVAAGPHKVQVRRHNDPNAIVFETNLELRKNQYYTLAASGMVANIRPVVFSATAVGKNINMARVQFFHLSPDLGKVDVRNASLRDVRLVQGLEFDQKRSTFVNVARQNLRLLPADQTEPLLKQLEDFPLTEERSYSVFVFGLAKGQGAQELTVVKVQDKARAEP